MCITMELWARRGLFWGLLLALTSELWCWGVAVLLCDIDRCLTRWYSRVAIQGIRQEIADGLKTCLNAALDNYHQVRTTAL